MKVLLEVLFTGDRREIVRLRAGEEKRVGRQENGR